MRRIAIGGYLENACVCVFERFETTSTTRGHIVQDTRARTGRPQPTQSSSTVPSLFTPPVGVPEGAGVTASLGGVPGLELGCVLCDEDAATPAAAATTEVLDGAGVWTIASFFFFLGTRAPLGNKFGMPAQSRQMSNETVPCLQLPAVVSVNNHA
jgi:hypothetical protein